MGFFDFLYPEGRSPQLTTAQAYKEYQAGARLIDIRDLIDWNKGHIAGSEHIPQARLLRPSSGLDKTQRLILVCSDGQQSLHTAYRMQNAGYDAISIHGGLASWKSSGLPFS
ncbi:hypothetical protein JTE88_03440 [Arcanobacterium phocisimile]|uniref:Rhodanese domain-containing protein n=1 Tax=Arcanobacterium phocisimile TaxID=1302235 RepID=A0ABX7II39_9ACTO|nr:rhodanese-like domain-containing protein [Arcanobacterium phocisimile]QRV02796.1 hypothetical protein JTE88_03440 [Arcanobacterium phocisimile]